MRLHHRKQQGREHDEEARFDAAGNRLVPEKGTERQHSSHSQRHRGHPRQPFQNVAVHESSLQLDQWVYGRKSANNKTVNDTRWLSIHGVRMNRMTPTAVSRGTVVTVVSWIEVITCAMLMSRLIRVAAPSTGMVTQKAAWSAKRANCTT